MGITLGENSCSRALCAIKLKPDSSWVHFLTQNIVPASVASASPGNLVELQILRSHPRYTESEALGGAQKSVFFFYKLSRWSGPQWSLRSDALSYPLCLIVFPLRYSLAQSNCTWSPVLGSVSRGLQSETQIIHHFACCVQFHPFA